MLCHILAEEGERVWLAFRRPADENDGARPATHYVVCSADQAVLIDPGGPADFGPLLAAVSDKIDLTKINAIVLTQPAAHAIGSAGLWAEVLGHQTPVYVSEMLAADILHLDADLNVNAVAESGGEVPMSDGSGLHLIAAPYLSSVASMSVYDPVARVLYTGEVGTVEGPWVHDDTPFVERFGMVSHAMNAFHQAWLASASARDDWRDRVNGLEVEIIAPRSGPCLRGREVDHFLAWFEALDVGVLVASHEPSFLSQDPYSPDRAQSDGDVFERRAAGTVPSMMVAPEDDDEDDDEGEDEDEDADDDDAFGGRDEDDEDEDADEDADEDDERKQEDDIDAAARALVDSLYASSADTPSRDSADVARLVDALPEPGDAPDEVADTEADDDFEIIYVDEDGNEIDPSEIDDAELIEEEEYIEGNDEIRLEFPPGKMFRLITRSDFDGLVCAVLLEELDLINDILFVHPNQMQEGEIEVSEDDISTNLPYTPGIFAAFDHHLSEVKRLGKHYDNHLIDPLAPSAARVVYNYFGGKKRFPEISDDMMDAVDKGDSAQFSIEEVLEPDGWPLLNFIMDSRTGLGRYRGFRVPNYELMMSLIDYCRRYSIEDILKHPDVVERVDLYREHQAPAKEQLLRCTTLHGNLAVVDYREEETIYVTNRFMVYALFPQCNISMHVLWGRAKQNTVFAVGKSIFNRTSKTNIGELMLTYGGGGHKNAGTCQSDNSLSDVVRDALIKRIKADG